MSTTVSFVQEENQLILVYAPTDGEAIWLEDKLKSHKDPLIGSIFHLSSDKVLPYEEVLEKEFHQRYFEFKIGEKRESYYHIDQEILNLDYDLAIHESIELEVKHFRAERNISIFGRIREFKLESLYIGGDHEDAVPYEVFQQLLKKFPTTREMDKYASNRVAGVLKNYLVTEVDLEVDYQKFLNKHLTAERPDKILVKYSEYEHVKFEELHDKLSEMLDSGKIYHETEWQELILPIVQLIFPRYIRAFMEAPVVDTWWGKRRRLDYLLVDASGFVDVIEIKRPEENALVTEEARCRDNFVPVRKLTDAIMQIEKYVFHLKRWGEQGEKKLQEKYEDQLPANVKVKVVNPQGMLIMGRTDKLRPEQKNDFEVIRRQYRNIVDIITYDDLLHRLKVISEQFKSLGEGA